MACKALCHDIDCMHDFPHSCHLGTCRPAPEGKRPSQPTRQQTTQEPGLDWPLALVLSTFFLSLAAAFIALMVIVSKGH
jgi:hypothetical protein